ncbi:30S ribosomal protein S6 [bacterium]|nr:30S ribosomal protein S6 [bacterium]
MAKEKKSEGIGDGGDGAEARIYEVGYHLISNLSEEALPSESAKIKDGIVSLGGMILSEEEPKFLQLAYRMDKTVGNKRVWFDGAYFGWVKFEAGSGIPLKLKKFLEENENILRFLITKTVRENTMVKKSLLLAKPPVVSPPSLGKSLERESGEEKSESSALPIVDEEALDKQIDDLVIQ